MESDTLGKRLIRSLLSVGEFDLKKYGLTSDDLEFDAKIAADFVIDFIGKYDKVPTEDQLVENTFIEFSKDPEEPAYVAEMLINRKANKQLEGDIRLLAKSLINNGPKDTHALLKKFASFDYFPVTKDSTDEFFIADAHKRYDRYIENKESQEVGIEFYWATLNEATGGLIDSELTILIAPSSTGKSWSSCITASHALNQGKRVLFVTLEMSAPEILGRLDTVHYKVPYHDIRSNDIEVFTEKRWKEAIFKSHDENSGEILVVDKNSVQYVSDIPTIAKDYKPDLVIVDGGYLFESHRNGTTWERTASVVTDIQTTCQKMKIPWFVTTQQNIPDKKVMTSVEKANKVRYGKEWWLVANIMIELSQSEEQRDILHEVSMNVIKLRGADRPDIKTNFDCQWDFEFANFEEIPDDFEYDLEVDY